MKYKIVFLILSIIFSHFTLFNSFANQENENNRIFLEILDRELKKRLADQNQPTGTDRNPEVADRQEMMGEDQLETNKYATTDKQKTGDQNQTVVESKGVMIKGQEGLDRLVAENCASYAEKVAEDFFNKEILKLKTVLTPESTWSLALHRMKNITTDIDSSYVCNLTFTIPEDSTTETHEVVMQILLTKNLELANTLAVEDELIRIYPPSSIYMVVEGEMTKLNPPPLSYAIVGNLEINGIVVAANETK